MKIRCSRLCAKNPARQQGATMVELIIALPMFVMFIFIIAELSMMHQAKSVVDMAALAAARTGAIQGGDSGAMKNAATVALVPLYANSTGLGALATGWLKAKTHATLPHAVGTTDVINVPFSSSFNGASIGVKQGITVDIISPTQQMMKDFGVTRTYTNTVSYSGAGKISKVDTKKERVIPSDNLMYRQTTLRNGVNIQDANLLKIPLMYLYKMKIPLTRYFFTFCSLIYTAGQSKLSPPLMFRR
jgi:Flp pilus assembly protein TadG